MSTTDRILGVIDAGLQHSDEVSYGTDHSPDLCARCQKLEPATGGDLCEGCRAFLLGDSEQDPKERRRSYPREGMFAHIVAEENVSTDEDLAANVARYRITISVDTSAFTDAVAAMGVSTQDAADAFRALPPLSEEDFAMLDRAIEERRRRPADRFSWFRARRQSQ